MANSGLPPFPTLDGAISGSLIGTSPDLARLPQNLRRRRVRPVEESSPFSVEGPGHGAGEPAVPFARISPLLRRDDFSTPVGSTHVSNTGRLPSFPALSALVVSNAHAGNHRAAPVVRLQPRVSLRLRRASSPRGVESVGFTGSSSASRRFVEIIDIL